MRSFIFGQEGMLWLNTVARHALFGKSSNMNRRYLSVFRRGREVHPQFGDGFWQGLASFSSLGAQFHDLSGYPHDTIADAIANDWLTLASDVHEAFGKLERGDDEQGRAEAASESTRQSRR